MPETPTFGRYAEIPYEQMTPEQQEGSASEMVARRPPLERLGTRISAADARRLYCSN
jgi:hypothetical protein